MDKKETAAQRRRRLEKAKLKRQKKIAKESDDDKKQRLEKARLSVAKHRENESQEKRSIRLASDKIRSQERRKNETEELRALRRLADKVRAQKRRQNESEEERSARLDRRRKAMQRRNMQHGCVDSVCDPHEATKDEVISPEYLPQELHENKEDLTNYNQSEYKVDIYENGVSENVEATTATDDDVCEIKIEKIEVKIEVTSDNDLDDVEDFISNNKELTTKDVLLENKDIAKLQLSDSSSKDQIIEQKKRQVSSKYSSDTKIEHLTGHDNCNKSEPIGKKITTRCKAIPLSTITTDDAVYEIKIELEPEVKEVPSDNELDNVEHFTSNNKELTTKDELLENKDIAKLQLSVRKIKS